METSQEREKMYLEKYIIVVIDPETGNQADFEFDTTRSYIPKIEEICGIPLSSAMKRLKIRSNNV